jgi:hypothetical protein
MKTIAIPISLLLLLLLSVGTMHACGPTTHQEIVERAPASVDPVVYADLLEVVDYRTWERDCGSVFPDWGYGMYYLHQDETFRTLSYVAHDYTEPSFRQACIDYVREHFTTPYESYEEMTASFMLGIVGHQEADYDWHDNFIPVASAEDNTNEAIIEGGCDLFVNWEWGEKWDFIKAFCPVDIMREVYRMVGYEVDRFQFMEGLVLLRVGIIADKALGYLTYLFAISVLPWTHENYSDYPAGGLDDCAEKVARGWEEMWDGFCTPAEAGSPAPRQSYTPGYDISRDNELVLRTAARLLKAGAVSVKIQTLPRGGVLIDTPQISDPDLFWSIIEDAFHSHPDSFITTTTG